MDSNNNLNRESSTSSQGEKSTDSKCNFMPSAKVSSTENKFRRAHRVIWTPSATTEKETYRTVVVNYHYGKLDTKRPNACPIPTTSNMQSEEEDDVPNLRRLYSDASKDELSAHSSKSSNAVPDGRENFPKISSVPNVLPSYTYKPDNKTEEIKVEIFNMPPVQEATVEEHQPEVIVLSSDNSTTDCAATPHPSIQIGFQNHESSTDATPAPTPISTTANSTQVSFVNIEESREPKLNPMDTPLQETPSSQKLKLKSQSTNTFKQRQLELHRHRIAVEQKRLELLETKLARERDEMIRDRILFEKDLIFKSSQIRKLNEDQD